VRTSLQEYIEAAFREQPPAPINEAVTRIEQRTGIKWSPTQVRQFLKKMGLRGRTVGVLPAKVDPEGPEELDSLLTLKF